MIRYYAIFFAIDSFDYRFRLFSFAIFFITLRLFLFSLFFFFALIFFYYVMPPCLLSRWLAAAFVIIFFRFAIRYLMLFSIFFH